MNIKAVGKNLLVQLIDSEEVTKAGLITKINSNTGMIALAKVISVGDLVENKDLVEGTKVFFPKSQGKFIDNFTKSDDLFVDSSQVLGISED